MATELESQAFDDSNFPTPVWCVGHKIADPNLHIDANTVDTEGNAGVGFHSLFRLALAKLISASSMT
jgi:hypothetical protein